MDTWIYFNAYKLAVLCPKISESSNSLDVFFPIRFVTVDKIMMLEVFFSHVFSVYTKKLQCFVGLLSFANSTIIKNKSVSYFNCRNCRSWQVSCSHICCRWCRGEIQLFFLTHHRELVRDLLWEGRPDCQNRCGFCGRAGWPSDQCKPLCVGWHHQLLYVAGWNLLSLCDG